MSPRGRLWAAVLACGGPDAVVLSHTTAAALWDLVPLPARVDVTTLRRGASTRAIRVHRSRTLDRAGDVIALDGLPLTTVARTLLDLADVLTEHQLERVCHRAEVVRRLDVGALQRPAGRRTAKLDRALATLAPAEPQVTRSALEERFLALVAGAGLPRPHTNVLLHGFEVDVLWAPAKLVAELDGRAAHLTATAFERDRRRDAVLGAAGYGVERFSWTQVTRRPAEVLAVLRARLA